MILVTGAAGKTGQAVIAVLASYGYLVRALVRRPAQVAAVEAAGATQAVVGEMTSAQAWGQAAASPVQSIYHLAPNMHPAEVEMGRLAIEACQAAGVRHFVYHSVLHPQTEGMPHHWHKLRVEELLLASGLPFTILQPTAYMQNILARWPEITGSGVYTVPYPVTTRLSLVDLGDVAAIAAAVLTTPGHEGATYELVGTRPLSQQEVVTIIGQQLGRPVTARAIEPAEWRRQAAENGLSDYAIETLLQMFDYYRHHGLIGNQNVLASLLGRPPTSLATFIRRIVS